MDRTVAFETDLVESFGGREAEKEAGHVNSPI